MLLCYQKKDKYPKTLRGCKVEKIKIFSMGDANNFGSLEDDFNAWIQKNPNIKILSRHVSNSGLVNTLNKPVVNCTIVVFYTDKV